MSIAPMAVARIIISLQDHTNIGSAERPRWQARSGGHVVVGVVDRAEADQGSEHIYATYIRPHLAELTVDSPTFTRTVCDWDLRWDGTLMAPEQDGMEDAGVSPGCPALGAGGAGPWCPIWTASAVQAQRLLETGDIWAD